MRVGFPCLIWAVRGGAHAAHGQADAAQLREAAKADHGDDRCHDAGSATHDVKSRWVLFKVRSQVHAEKPDKKGGRRHAQHDNACAKIERQQPVAVAVENQLNDLLSIVYVRIDLLDLGDDLFHLLLKAFK